MATFDIGSTLNSVVSGTNSALSSARTVATRVGNLAGTLNNLSDPSKLVSSLRSLGIPPGGEIGLLGTAVSAIMGGTDASNDWRVRLSIPSSFLKSPVLQPLRDSDNSLIFPYTPTIQLSGGASYDEQAITHQNYQFVYYQNSRADQIHISAPFNVEDGAQALYWIAAVHFLRSATKMFTGDDANAGNPPPLMRFNGYGDYVFKNIPVVIKNFSIDMPSDVNYINTSMAAAMATSGGGVMSSIAGIAGTTSQLAGLAGAVGANKAARALGKVGAVGGAIAGVGKILGDLGSSGTSAVGNSWVPVKSTLSLTLQPIYSRTATRQFNLTSFVNGEYVNSGYL